MHLMLTLRTAVSLFYKVSQAMFTRQSCAVQLVSFLSRVRLEEMFPRFCTYFLVQCAGGAYPPLSALILHLVIQNTLTS